MVLFYNHILVTVILRSIFIGITIGSASALACYLISQVAHPQTHKFDYLVACLAGYLVFRLIWKWSDTIFNISNKVVGHSTESAMHVIEQEYDVPREDIKQDDLDNSGHRELDEEVNQVWGYVAKITYSVAVLLTLITAGGESPDRTLMLTNNLWIWSITTGIFSMLLLSLGQDYFTTAVKIRREH